MQISKSAERLRTLRDVLGRTKADGDAEGGFTLIELMVVLLIMAILLAIAIPTFLSVTGGAKKTAAQSNLTNTLESAQAVFTKVDSFPATTTGTPPGTTPEPATLVTDLGLTQTTITYVAGATTPAKGKNSVSVAEPTVNLVVVSAIDGDGDCWVAAINEGSSKVGTIEPGDNYAGLKSTDGAVVCNATLFVTGTTTGISPTGWKQNFGTLKTPAT